MTGRVPEQEPRLVGDMLGIAVVMMEVGMFVTAMSWLYMFYFSGRCECCYKLIILYIATHVSTLRYMSTSIHARSMHPFASYHIALHPLCLTLRKFMPSPPFLFQFTCRACWYKLKVVMHILKEVASRPNKQTLAISRSF